MLDALIYRRMIYIRKLEARNERPAHLHRGPHHPPP